MYATGLWGPGQTPGSGSTAEQARPYLDIVNGLIRVGGWTRVIDLGSGDGFVASRLEAPEVIGVECHRPHVERLCAEVPDRKWLNLDIDRDRDQLPAGDAAFLKDVLHHWPNRLVREWLGWAKKCGKWKWLVCAQDRHQFADGQDCPLGGFRGLNPALSPLRQFDFHPLCEYLYKGVLLLRILWDRFPTRPAVENRPDGSETCPTRAADGCGQLSRPLTTSPLTSSRGWFRWLYTMVSGLMPTEW